MNFDDPLGEVFLAEYQRNIATVKILLSAGAPLENDNRASSEGRSKFPLSFREREGARG